MTDKSTSSTDKRRRQNLILKKIYKDLVGILSIKLILDRTEYRLERGKQIKKVNRNQTLIKEKPHPLDIAESLSYNAWMKWVKKHE